MAGQPVSRRALLLGHPAKARGQREDRLAEGDHRLLGRRLEPAAERIVQATAIGTETRLLDLSAGDGSAALAAARAGADVVAVEPSPALVAEGRARSERSGLAVDWRVADAESLPLDDAGIDCVASKFGLIHARDCRRAVDEIDRVLRPGGRLQFADVVIHHEVSEDARARIDLWTG